MKKEVRKRDFKCFYCDTPIKFDTSVRSKNNRPIPLNLDGSNHDCPESPFNKGKASKDRQQQPQQQPVERPEAAAVPEPQPTTTTTTQTLKVSEPA
jgi:hypothetical protein